MDKELLSEQVTDYREEILFFEVDKNSLTNIPWSEQLQLWSVPLKVHLWRGAHEPAWLWILVERKDAGQEAEGL